MPTQANIAAIYGFETVLATAVSEVLTDAQLTCRIVSDNPQFQETRPRVDIAFHSAGNFLQGGRVQYATPNVELDPTDKARARAFSGTLQIQAITDISSAGKSEHNAYVATVRYYCATLASVINSKLTNHTVNFVTEGNCTWGFNTDKGYEVSDMSYDVIFGIRPDAWKLLYA